MSFDPILKDIAQKTGAYGAVIMASDGESVASYSAPGGPQMELIGAQHAAIFNMIKDVSRRLSGSSGADHAAITTKSTRLMLLSLKDGYFLLLAMDKSKHSAKALFESRSAVKRIEEEMG